MNKKIRLHIFQTKDTPTSNLLQIELEKRGHTVTKGNLEYFELTNPESFDVSNIDVMYYWGGMGKFSRAPLLKYLDTKQIPFANRAVIDDVDMLNKIGQVYRVANACITTPKTIVGPALSFNKISEICGCPFIMKDSLGSCGSKVFLISSETEFENIKKSNSLGEVLYQTYIPNDGDFRVHVIDGVARCAYRRTPKEGNFKSNIAQGGLMSGITDEQLLGELYAYAEKITKVFKGSEIVGVDIMRHAHTGELYFIEINYIPGIGDDVTEATGVKLEIIMADYFESIAKKR